MRELKTEELNVVSGGSNSLTSFLCYLQSTNSTTRTTENRDADGNLLSTSIAVTFGEDTEVDFGFGGSVPAGTDIFYAAGSTFTGVDTDLDGVPEYFNGALFNSADEGDGDNNPLSQ